MFLKDVSKYSTVLQTHPFVYKNWHDINKFSQYKAINWNIKDVSVKAKKEKLLEKVSQVLDHVNWIYAFIRILIFRENVKDYLVFI